jgi:CO/xanthine dehydrogenase Mo-binding subunit
VNGTSVSGRLKFAVDFALPGVLGVLVAEDTPGTVWHGCWLNYRGKALDGIARFVGDEVAAVAAVSQEIAEAALDLPQSKVRVISMPTGSSFGQWWSNNFMMITALLARKVGKAVKIELDNAECFTMVKRRHKEHARGRIGATNDGRITFIDIDHLMDNGGYGFKNSVGLFAVDNWGRAESGRCVIQGVSTNLVTAGCMRGVGDVTLGSVFERLCDMAAAKLGIDPVTFRLSRQIRPGDVLRHIKGKDAPEIAAIRQDPEGWRAKLSDDMREHWPEPFRLSSGSTEEILRDGEKAFGWDDKRAGWGEPYSIDGAKRRAVGVGTGIQCCGVELGGNSAAVVRINPDGSAKVFCAVGRHGQGSETTQSQVASEALGIPSDRVEIETGDTDSCPWSHGSIASNTMYRTGFAAWSAAMDAKRQLLEIAARDLFDTDPGELEVKDGVVVFKHPPRGGNPRPISWNSRSTPRPARSRCWAMSRARTAGPS